MTDFVSPYIQMVPRERRDVALSLLLQSIEDARRAAMHWSEGGGDPLEYFISVGDQLRILFTRYDQYTASVFQPDSIAAEHAQIGKDVEGLKT